MGIRRLRLSAFWVVTGLFLLAALRFTIGVEARRERWSDAVQVAEGEAVQLMYVVDGDEVQVKAGERAFGVRLLGLKCFESGTHEPGIAGLGEACKSELQRLAEGGPLTLHFEGEPETDRHNRVLAYLHADGEDVALKLIAGGYGMAYTRYPFARESSYVTVEREAVANRRGLWALDRASTRARALKSAWAVERRSP